MKTPNPPRARRADVLSFMLALVIVACSTTMTGRKQITLFNDALRAAK